MLTMMVFVELYMLCFEETESTDIAAKAFRNMPLPPW